ncbi:MAG TPA: hypothetical protein VIK78_17670 [Ruminiclostridium sp.]
MKYFFDTVEEIQSSVTQNIYSANRVVDIGCGIQPQKFIDAQVHICIEPYSEYVAILQERFPDKIIINAGWSDAIKFLPTKSVDSICILDVIEHLEKDEGMELLKLTMKIPKKQLIIFTPLGFFEQHNEDGIDAWGLHGGEWQRHRSGWLPEDFPQIEGGKWDFYICETFHKTNANGEPLIRPAGAFYAIFNFVNELDRSDTVTNNKNILFNSLVTIGQDKKSMYDAIGRGNSEETLQLLNFIVKNYKMDFWQVFLNLSFVVEKLKMEENMSEFVPFFNRIISERSFKRGKLYTLIDKFLNLCDRIFRR